MNWCCPDSFGLDRRFGTDHSTIASGSMVGPLDDRRVACLGRPLHDRRVVRWSDHSTINEWPAWADHVTIVEWPPRSDHSTIFKWFDARTTR
ncbi:hypothetical protein DY000_02007581 [Brassica cretica]|uniref:Uncharacterized protein n=1 Tax=Brassica cretica TaxID=69181 RepID=A0ABQ7BVG1_BRACR|nr:hypothetical protein DY000_02007581 [Brassica cretica]